MTLAVQMPAAAQPLSRPVSSRVAVLALTRAGVVSLLRTRKPPGSVIRREYAVGDYGYSVEIASVREFPHSIDWDVCGGLETLFYQQGCAARNVLSATPRQMLSVAGLDDSGRYYATLRESLMRLEAVRWVLRRIHLPSGVAETTTTGFISEMRMYDRTVGASRTLLPEAAMEIYLTPSFADLIRAGLHQMLDDELLSRISQPSARGMYRLLEGHRVQADGSLAQELEVSLQDWITACGVSGDRPDNARLALIRANAHLLESGYLRRAEIVGRGQKARLVYEFAHGAADHALVELLVSHRVQRPVAESLASKYPERIRVAVEAVQARLNEGFTPSSLGAVVVDAVRNPEKYAASMTGFPEPVTKATERSRKAGGQRARGSEPAQGASGPSGASGGPAMPVLLEEPEPSDEGRRSLVRSVVSVRFRRTLSAEEDRALEALSGERLALLVRSLMEPRGLPAAEILAEGLSVS